MYTGCGDTPPSRRHEIGLFIHRLLGIALVLFRDILSNLSTGSYFRAVFASLCCDQRGGRPRGRRDRCLQGVRQRGFGQGVKGRVRGSIWRVRRWTEEMRYAPIKKDMMMFICMLVIAAAEVASGVLPITRPILTPAHPIPFTDIKMSTRSIRAYISTACYLDISRS